MGLIGGILETLYLGTHSYFTSPFSFIKHPISWLNGISNFRATISAAPNFAYDLLSNIPDYHIPKTLDLSSWKTAFCGAEPIQWGALKLFAEKYEKYGFDERIFHPCYGLAEATLYVCGDSGPLTQHVNYFDKDGLSKNKLISVDKSHKNSQALVASGICDDDTVKIVAHETNQLLDDGLIGRILVTGDSLTKGYWGNKEATQQLFCNLKGEGTGAKFINTGDCGAIVNNKLYVVGREKDLVIIHGKNYYVSYLERAVADSHKDLRKGCVVIVQDPDDGKIILLAEIKTSPDEDSCMNIIECMNKALFNYHEIEVDKIYLLPKQSIPKTTSGKIARFECITKLKNNEFSIIFSNVDTIEQFNAVREQYKSYDKEQLLNLIRDCLIDSLLKILSCQPSELQSSIMSNDLDSLDTLQLCRDINKKLCLRLIEPMDIYACNEINHLMELIYVRIVGGPNIPKNKRDKRIPLLDNSIKPANKIFEHRPIKNILLTGVTGFLGSHLLMSLLNKTEAIIYCIIRANSIEHARERLINTFQKYDMQLGEAFFARIRVIQGDCSVTNFGIASETYNNLASLIDQIINSAAEVHFLKNETALHRSNVFSVEQVLKFACTSKLKRVEHISTFSITLSPSEEIDINKFIIKPPALQLGYVQSKWLAESLCQQGISRGIPINIYRVGNIGGHSKKKFYNEKDVLTNIFIASFKSKYFVDFELKVSLAPVDYVSDDIVQLSQLLYRDQIFNIFSPKAISVKLMLIVLNLLGKKIKIVDFDSWVDILIKKSDLNDAAQSLQFIPLFFSNKKKGHQLLKALANFDPAKHKRENRKEKLMVDSLGYCNMLKILRLYMQRFTKTT